MTKKMTKTKSKTQKNTKLLQKKQDTKAIYFHSPTAGSATVKRVCELVEEETSRIRSPT